MPEFEFSDLVTAYFDCRKRKRNTLSAIEFEFHLEQNLLQLYNELIDGSYKIGPSICFVVLEPKPREVWAANFRDRIVHHLVCNAISQRFYDRFIKDTFSCIPKRGTLNAGKVLASYIRSASQNYTKNVYYLKADIRNFFVSINRNILYELLLKQVHEQWLQKLLHQIIFNDCKSECIIRSPQWKFDLLPYEKSLWHSDHDKGLPIGNLTSQFFSNVYLNELDQYVKHHWHCKYYCRYVDDFVILDEDPKKLNEIHKDLTRFLKEELDLELHQKKKSINKVIRGVDFVGYVLKKNRNYLRQKTLKKMFKIIRLYKQSDTFYSEEEIKSFISSVNSYLGMLRNTNGYNLRKKICAKSINLFVSCDKEYKKLVSNV